MAIWVTKSTQSLVVKASGSPNVTQPTFSAHYRVISDQSLLKDAYKLLHGQLNGASEVVIVSPPDSGTLYAFVVQELGIYNMDTGPMTIAVLTKDTAAGVPYHKEWQGVLQSGEFVILNNKGIWNTYLANGLQKSF